MTLRHILSLTTLLTLITCVTDPNHRVAADESSAKIQTEFSDAPNERSASADKEIYVPKSEKELRRSLTRIQFDVTQNESTEPAFRNKYWNNKDKGEYTCIVCGQKLFTSDTKFKSGTGWPSFYAPADNKNVGYKTDNYLFYTRTEVHCSRCNAHLGHVFDDGPKPTGKRYCMNSASMNFVEKKSSKLNEDKAPADSPSESK
ncbi:peptide-methionine (R)-S-oxide reductase MsrB [Rubripirellula reticaptiva]|uniref:peptide-methionine (R)-S-oxide reductase n=1 Tax=Rubripirellula reticaptiva TaxID=2528013 RepID=A0A5C6F0U3_9BACT|nr:peptide-methionine (R)-S-oxide reductase MsrB [Rubripirellula reticaptiva]TWU55453.1 Peptide methionine sulfoxide reductase MsrB [Rubripirellula reticaptiva]